MNTASTPVIVTGEGMAALWGGLKSIVQPGDTVLAVDNGLYGRGIGEMAATIGALVTYHASDATVSLLYTTCDVTMIWLY